MTVATVIHIDIYLTALPLSVLQPTHFIGATSTIVNSSETVGIRWQEIFKERNHCYVVYKNFHLTKVISMLFAKYTSSEFPNSSAIVSLVVSTAHVETSYIPVYCCQIHSLTGN